MNNTTERAIELLQDLFEVHLFKVLKVYQDNTDPVNVLHNMDDLDDVLCGWGATDIIDVVERSNNFNLGDKYFSFDGYCDLESYDYISDFLDDGDWEDIIQDMIQNRCDYQNLDGLKAIYEVLDEDNESQELKDLKAIAESVKESAIKALNDSMEADIQKLRDATADKVASLRADFDSMEYTAIFEYIIKNDVNRMAEAFPLFETLSNNHTFPTVTFE